MTAPRYRTAWRTVGTLVLLIGLITGPTGAAASAEEPRTFTGEINGANYRVVVPADWNGTLLLYSHGGYTPDFLPPADQIALTNRPQTADWLLEHGYALAASNFSTPHYWAVHEALIDQIALLDWFEQHIGPPRHTISTGSSLGGLIAILLAEHNPDRFDGLLAMCGADAGGTGTWNIGLDFTFAVRTLLAPASDLELVRITRPEAATATLEDIVRTAAGTPAGRARLALANALAGVSDWSHALEPPPADTDSRIRQQVDYDLGTLIPLLGPAARSDLERRAGGNPSWNIGVSYDEQLERSVHRALVRQAYLDAGLDLNTDLRRLAATPRITADPDAAIWLAHNGTPDGRAGLPTITLSGVSDTIGLTEAARWYGQRVRRNGDPADLRQLFVNRAGHCMFTSAEEITSVTALRTRVRTGRWGDTTPATLTANAARLGPEHHQLFDWITGMAGTATPAFTTHCPGPFPRPST